ncbi:MAG: hypothetical protein Q9165_004877 [Trypethelium subeluteriae]
MPHQHQTEYFNNHSNLNFFSDKKSEASRATEALALAMSSRMQNYIKSFSPKGKGVDVNEISFAKQFLTSADQKPLKLSADHVEDPRKLPAQPALNPDLRQH